MWLVLHREVIKKIDEDTVLLVFGDHGMTPSGDHGGDSALEVSSALFLYSPTPFTAADPVQKVEKLFWCFGCLFSSVSFA